MMVVRQPLRAAPAALAIARFHLGSGARLAMRAGAPAAGAAVVAIGIGPDPAATLEAIVRAIADSRSGPGVPMIATALSIGLAVWAAPRIAHGSGGWLRHLPVSSAANRRGIVLALVAGQAPVWATCWAAWFAARADGAVADPVRLATSLAIAFSVAVAVTPTRRTWARWTTGATAGTIAIALEPSWIGPLAAGGVLIVGELAAAPVGRSHRRLAPARAATSGAASFSVRVAARAIRRRVPVAWILGAAPIGAAGLYLANNAGIDGTGAVRLAGGVSATIVVADLAAFLAVSRPAWGWARSLPWSAARRTAWDAATLASLALPSVLAAGWLAPATAAPTALVAIAAAASAAASVRTGHPGRAATWGPVLAIGLVLSLWTAVDGRAAWAAALVAVVALREAARRELDLRPSVWDPMRHDAEGDPRSWRGA